jgi:hypothetical protein
MFNPFIFIRNKSRVMFSEGFSAVEKKRIDMSSEGCAAHSVGYRSPLKIVMAVRQIFLKFNLLGRVWGPGADYGCLAELPHLTRSLSRKV